MRKSRLIYLICLFAILIAGIFLADKSLGYLYTQNPNIKANFIRLTPPNAGIVLLGSSNVMTGFDPMAVRQATGLSTYSLSVYHSGFLEQKALLMLYLQYNQKPKYVVIGFNSADMNLYPEVFHTEQLIAYIHHPSITAIIEQKDPMAYRFIQIPLLRYTYNNPNVWPYVAQETFKLLKGNNKAYSENGYYQLPLNPGWFQRFQNTQTIANKGLSCILTPKDAAELTELLGFIRQQNLKCLIIQTPAYSVASKFLTDKEKGNTQIQKLTTDFKYFTLPDSLTTDSANFRGVFHSGPQGARKNGLWLGKMLRSERE